jgi:uncharacterized protein YpmB
MERKMDMKKTNLNIIIIILGILAAVIMIFQIQNNQKSSFEKAVDDISNGVSNAADEFKEKTPAEKVGDAVKDAGQKVKDSSTK